MKNNDFLEQKKKTPCHNNYLKSSRLIRAYQNKDLGILFELSLPFNAQRTYINMQNKASSVLGLVGRS